jgi:hypothetical protein
MTGSRAISSTAAARTKPLFEGCTTNADRRERARSVVRAKEISAVLHWNVRFKPVLAVLVIVAASVAALMGWADGTCGIYW